MWGTPSQCVLEGLGQTLCVGGGWTWGDVWGAERTQVHVADQVTVVRSL